MTCFHNLRPCLRRISSVLGLCLASCYAVAGEAPDTCGSVDGTHFHVAWTSRTEPLPLNRIHNWLLHIDTLTGNPVEKAEVHVSGGMPAHKHGLPTQPAVTDLGNGDYLVEGLKFSMTGTWEMWFDIRAGKVTDKVKFTIIF